MDKAWAHEARNLPPCVRRVHFRDAVALTMVRCCLGAKTAVLAWAFNIGSCATGAAAPTTVETTRVAVGDVFKLTILCCNYFFEKTVARVPDIAEVDRNTMPSYRHPTLANVMLTVDATNVVTQRPRTAYGQRESFSDYYGACCGKFEVCTGPDGMVLWVSPVFGGRASEKAIMQKSNFVEFYKSLAEKCVDEDGKQFAPAVMSDKGTRIDDLCKLLEAEYLTPPVVTDGRITYQDALRGETISRARAHVEAAIGKMKVCAILRGGITHRLAYLVDEIVYFCAFITHFYPRRVAK